jgi:PelA/Pel-15E family pectate lyase
MFRFSAQRPGPPHLFVLRAAAIISLSLSCAIVSHAAVIGANPPAQSLTRKRIASLPAAQRRIWFGYLASSNKQRNADKGVLQSELKTAGLSGPLEPPHSSSARSIRLEYAASWYAQPEALRIGDIIVSFQTPAGGWSKNIDMSKEPRRPSETFAPDNLSRFHSAGDYDAPLEPNWNYVGTIDNDATTTQLQFLAKLVAAIGDGNRANRYRVAFLRGMNYLFAAQYPGGGWPQVWPLEGGYHDAITYNDGAMVHVIRLMRSVTDGSGEFAFVPEAIRKRAASSFGRALDCILSTQIVSNDERTVWPQQADPLTLEPVSARNYEPPAEASCESAAILQFLMDIPHPTAVQRQAIRAAAAWFRKTAIYDKRWQLTPAGRDIVAVPGAGPIWARYYQIGADRPVFADRDKSIHDNVSDISKERRNGYQWCVSRT